MDQTGFIRRFRDQFQAFEIEHGQGLIANQIARETISAISPYTWQKPVNISTIDESLGYNTAMLNKIQKLVESRIANAYKEAPLDRGASLYYKITIFYFLNISNSTGIKG